MKKISLLGMLLYAQLVSFSQNAFENTAPGTYATPNAITGWTIESGSNANSYPCGGTVIWSAGSPDFSVVATPVAATPWSSGLFSINNVFVGNSPLGGNNVVRLNDAFGSGIITKIKTNYTVTPSTSLVKIAFCGSWDQNAHTCCNRPAMLVNVYDCAGTFYSCYSLNLTPTNGGCPGNPSYSVTNNTTWNAWQVKTIDLSQFIGNCMRVEISSMDCNAGSHHGSAYVDVDFANSYNTASITPTYPISLPVSYCAGSNQASLFAPIGYVAYAWTGPTGFPIPSSQSTLSAITITNASPGNVYNVMLTTPAGCSFIAGYSLSATQVNVAGLGSTPSCTLGASGSATVLALGSGTGYNYTWLNSGNSVVGSSSVAANLLPGVYTVTMNAIGSVGCGSAAATVTVGTAPTSTYTIYHPYCGNQAIITAPAGSNRQWYSAGSALSPTLGGTATSLTVNSPVNGQVFWLSQVSPQGCKDSIQYQLNQLPSGSFSISSSFLTCAGNSNGSVNFSITPSSSAPTGSNSVYVFSSSVPQYTSGVSAFSLNTYTAANMPAGNYSVLAADGACQYLNTFTVSNYVYNYQVSPPASTLCAGSNYSIALNFTNTIVPGQYNYSVSPNNYISGSSQNPGNIYIQLNPLSPAGTSANTVYTVTVNPSAVNCPITKTFTVDMISLQTPTLSAPLPFCTNAPLQTVSATPAGGLFTAVNGNWIGTNSGVITPSLAVPGVNAFVYAISVSSCVASATASFTLAQFNSAAINATVSGLCRNGASLNLMSLVGSTVNGSWSGASVPNNIFTPTVAAGSYTLVYNTTSSIPGLCPDQALLLVNVYNTPTLSLQGNTIICSGQTTTITATGADSYSLNANATGSIMVLSPNASTTYSISGTSNNCSAVKLISIAVNPCTGIDEFNSMEGDVKIYPNPTKDYIFIELLLDAKITLSDVSGRKLLEQKVISGKHRLDLDDYSEGVYFLACVQNQKTLVAKIIVSR
jgi:hypothetical protein